MVFLVLDLKTLATHVRLRTWNQYLLAVDLGSIAWLETSVVESVGQSTIHCVLHFQFYAPTLLFVPEEFVVGAKLHVRQKIPEPVTQFPVLQLV